MMFTSQSGDAVTRYKFEALNCPDLFRTVYSNTALGTETSTFRFTAGKKNEGTALLTNYPQTVQWSIKSMVLATNHWLLYLGGNYVWLEGGSGCSNKKLFHSLTGCHDLHQQCSDKEDTLSFQCHPFSPAAHCQIWTAGIRRRHIKRRHGQRRKGGAKKDVITSCHFETAAQPSQCPLYNLHRVSGWSICFKDSSLSLSLAL